MKKGVVLNQLMIIHFFPPADPVVGMGRFIAVGIGLTI
jgi:hypothetical protein